MNAIKVEFDVVSISNPGTTSNVIRYYEEGALGIHQVIHDYLKLFFRVSKNGYGFVTFEMSDDDGRFSKDSMDRIREVINDILYHADGEIPLTELQKEMLLERLAEAKRMKK